MQWIFQIKTLIKGKYEVKYKSLERLLNYNHRINPIKTSKNEVKYNFLIKKDTKNLTLSSVPGGKYFRKDFFENRRQICENTSIPFWEMAAPPKRETPSSVRSSSKRLCFPSSASASKKRIERSPRSKLVLERHFYRNKFYRKFADACLWNWQQSLSLRQRESTLGDLVRLG